MKEVTILEYISGAGALMIVLIIMALISVGNMGMKQGLSIVICSLVPLFVISACKRRGKYTLYLILYLILSSAFLYLLLK